MTETSQSSRLIDDVLLKKGVSLFYHFEPFDGIPADEKHKAPFFADGGRPFQKSMMLSTARIRAAIAATQSGKTLGTAVETIAMITGEIPYCMRVEAGVSTGIKRALRSQHDDLGTANIRRFGRISKETGAIIDRDITADEDGTWDCGEIMGIGIYPEDKIAKGENEQAWICSYKQARDVRWIELIKTLMPEHCLDKTKGVNGYSSKNNEFHLIHNRRIIFITYEQGFERVEAKVCWVGVMDEEPLRREFFTSLLGHSKFMLISFTPLHGVIWTYDDLYLPAKNGTNPDLQLFHITAYDCPTYDPVIRKGFEENLQSHEKDAKLMGEYSRREGRPYFPYDICKRYLDDFEPRHKMLARIEPIQQCTNIREMYKTKMRVVPAEGRGNDVWEIYELPQREYTYFSAQDCARGSDDPEQVQDMSTCYIFRMPDDNKGENPEFPVHVATLYSGEPQITFAILCVYGSLFYNRCLMGPETKGEDGKSFLSEIRDYSHIMKMTLINDKTRKPTEHLGFDTNARTRTTAINKIRKWINNHPDQSELYHITLIKELLGMIWKKGRPDHQDGEKSDCVICFAIILWIWEEERYQIRNNRLTNKDEDAAPFASWMNRFMGDGKKRLGKRTLNKTAHPASRGIRI